MKFLHLTDLEGRSIAINQNQIDMLRSALPDEYGRPAHTVVIMNGGSTQAVRETLAEIEAKLAVPHAEL